MLNLLQEIEGTLQTGDIIFTREKGPLYLYQLAAKTTSTWATHIGVVACEQTNGFRVMESTFPYSQIVSLDNFISRAGGKIEIRRIKEGLAEEEKNKLLQGATSLMGQKYDLWFGKGLYCSKFVRKLYLHIGKEVCQIGCIGDILRNTNISKMAIFLWRLWYGGFIPISQECITVKDILESTSFETVYKYPKES
jgi:hypothetical protein